MARAYIIGHGCELANWPKTFVPSGKTVYFFSVEGELAENINLFAALNAGSLRPNEVKGSNEDVACYYLSAQDTDTMAAYRANESSLTGGELYFIGTSDLPAPLMLCSNPAKCEKTRPVHGNDCTGLFGRVREQEIFYMACRGVLRRTAPGTYEETPGTQSTKDLGGDAGENYNAIVARAQAILRDAQTDPQGAFDDFRSMPEAVKGQLRQVIALNDWLAQMEQFRKQSQTAAVWLPKEFQGKLLGNARPKKFEKCWNDDYWRNVFWYWFRGPARGNEAQEALLSLWDAMDTYYSSGTEQAALDVLEIAQGDRGAKPPVDNGPVSELASALEERESPKKAIDELYDSVKQQLDMVYEGFYEDVGTLKDAIR